MTVALLLAALGVVLAAAWRLRGGPEPWTVPTVLGPPRNVEEGLLRVNAAARDVGRSFERFDVSVAKAAIAMRAFGEAMARAEAARDDAGEEGR